MTDDNSPVAAGRSATVAFLGLGRMGYPMAAQIATRFPALVWNRTASVAARHSAEFGTRVIGLTDLGSADVVVTCLASSSAVDDVADRGLAYIRRGTVWIDCTSGRPDQSRAFGERLAAAGVDFLDAPVSGMAHRARDGTLTAIVGGRTEVLDRVRPVLDSICARIHHVGDVGAGHLVKAANNTLFAGGFWLAAEVLARLADAGIDPSVALDCFNASSGRSFVTEKFLPEFVVPAASDSSYRLGQSHRDVETFRAAVASAAPNRDCLIGWLEHAYSDLSARVGTGADAGAAFDGIGSP